MEDMQAIINPEIAHINRLSPDLIGKIFVNLPLKTLINCTSVCKKWNTFIKSPLFISTHLNSPATKINDVLFIRLDWSRRKCCYTLDRDDKKDYDFKLVKNFPVEKRTPRNVLACIDGLVFISTPEKFILWNPTIQRTFLLPLDFNFDGVFIGFGYDSLSDDYKFVKLTAPREELIGIRIEVFALNSNSWTKIEYHDKTDLRVKSLPPKNSQAFVKGAIHFVACGEESETPILLKFDLGEEILSEIMLPKELGQNKEVIWSEVSPFVYKDSTIVLFDSGSKCEIGSLWLMKEYGVGKSWAKVLTLRYDLKRRIAPKVLGFRKDGELMVVEFIKKNCEDLYAYKYEGGSVISWRNVQSGKFYGIFAGSLPESLVLLNRVDCS